MDGRLLSAEISGLIHSRSMDGFPRTRPLVMGALVAALLGAGCSGLIVRREDPADEQTAKILVRTTLAVGTLGLSEFVMGEIKLRERERRDQSGYWSHQREVRGEWRAALQDRLTEDEVSALFQSGPLSCTPVSGSHHVCVWMTPLPQTVYLTLGMGVQPLRIGTVVRAVCELPLDGTPRQPDACQVWSE
jgi:hypothetical protein